MRGVEPIITSFVEILDGDNNVELFKEDEPYINWQNHNVVSFLNKHSFLLKFLRILNSTSSDKKAFAKHYIHDDHTYGIRSFGFSSLAKAFHSAGKLTKEQMFYGSYVMLNNVRKNIVNDVGKKVSKKLNAKMKLLEEVLVLNVWTVDKNHLRNAANYKLSITDAYPNIIPTKIKYIIIPILFNEHYTTLILFTKDSCLGQKNKNVNIAIYTYDDCCRFIYIFVFVCDFYFFFFLVGIFSIKFSSACYKFKKKTRII